MTFLKPMQANVADPLDPKFERYKNYHMELKLDGWRCIAVKQGSDIQLYTRTGHSMTEKLPHIVQDLSYLQGDWIIDGEVGYLDSKAKNDSVILDYNTTARVLGSDVDEALRKQRQLFHDSEIADWCMQYYVFDWISPYNNLPAPLNYREAVLEELLLDLPVGRSVQLLTSVEGWHEHIYDYYVQDGGEGVMLKDPDGLYVSGKRPAHNWLKVKKYHTTSALIVGFVEGMGKYTNTLGAIKFVTQDGIPGHCSGMDDATRDLLWANPGKFIDKWIEIKHYGQVGRDSEGLRHPIFLRFREDLDS